jgi:hypothetical protein
MDGERVELSLLATLNIRAGPLIRSALLTTRAYPARRFHDPRLGAVLASSWPVFLLQPVRAFTRSSAPARPGGGATTRAAIRP